MLDYKVLNQLIFILGFNTIKCIVLSEEYIVQQ